jgi:glycosyltransferase involved in cell wall biosynthesis
MSIARLRLLVRRSVREGGHWLWQSLPFSIRRKQKIRNWLFGNFAFVFRGCRSFPGWQEDNAAVKDGLSSFRFPGGEGLAGDSARRIIVVSHDAQAHGAQFLALGMIRSLIRDLHLDVVVVLLGGGRLRKEFSALAPVHELDDPDPKSRNLVRLARELAERGFVRAIVNTTASAGVLPAFHDAGIESVCLVHELPGVIQSLKLEKKARLIALYGKAVVFPAQTVAEGFAQFASVDASRQVIRPQGLFRKNEWRSKKDVARAELRKRLGVEPDARVVLAVGYADYRKGVDLFVECAIDILAQRDDVHFVWVGHWDSRMEHLVRARLKGNAGSGHLHFVGYDPDTALYHAGADVYALTSREDPFPNVVMESFDAGVPVVAFASTGGAANLVESIGGMTASLDDIGGFAAAICRLLDSPRLAADLGKVAQDYVDRNFDFHSYLSDLCDMLAAGDKRKSGLAGVRQGPKFEEHLQ